MKLYKFNDKEAYKYCLYLKPFRIFYTTNGDDKTPKNLAFKKHKKFPDYIIDILQKFNEAYEIYTKNLHLKSPLKEGIYYDKGACFIDVMIVDIPVQKGLVAAELIDNSEYFIDDKSMYGKSIKVLLHKDLIKDTATPIHELFHVFQYNYSNFNNMWFMEGLARWSQNLTHTRKHHSEKLPANQEELEYLLNREHDAEYFFREIIQHTGTDIDFINTLLEQTALQMEKVENEHEIDSWKKVDKKSSLNNKYLLEAIKYTVETLQVNPDKELKNFLNAIEEYQNMHRSLNISKTVYIKNNTDLELLEFVDEIDGDLIIENTQIESLNSFNKLTKVKKIIIKDNPKLKEILGFNGLIKIENIEIDNNKNLEFIGGFFKFFNKIKRIDGYIKIISNKKLTNISFMQGLEYVGSSFYLHHNSLGNICGLSQLKSVGASFSLSGNNLTDLTSLINLQKVDGMLGVAYNNLSSLKGLENLQEISVTKWSNNYRSFAFQGNKYLIDIQAINNTVSNTTHVICYMDNNRYITPQKNTLFLDQTIEVFVEEKKIDTKKVFTEYTDPNYTKILFYNGWQKALQKHQEIKAYHLHFSNINSVVNFAKKHGVEYIYGQVYNAQKFLFKNKEALKKEGLKFIVNDFEVVRLILNKRDFYIHMIKNDLSNLIPTYYKSIEDIQYPVVIKETTDSNGKSVKIINNPSELPTIKDNEVLNEYIIGDTEYASNIFYKNGKILKDITYEKTFNKEHYVLNDETKYKMKDKKVTNSFIKDFEKTLQTLLPDGGYLTCCIDYKIKDNIPKIFEINVRFGYTLARYQDDFKEMMEVYMKECDHA